MKKLILKMLVIIISLAVFSGNVYATSTENETSNETTSSDTVSQEEEEEEEETPTETAMNQIMYVQERCNVRASYSVESDRVGGLDAGTEVTVIAEYSNGWYKIEYDGGEAYIKAGILRSTMPELEEEEEEEETEETTTEETEVVTEEENTDEVDIEDAELINEIGVLPEVGKNIADYFYFGIIILAVILALAIQYKRK